jgi:predicted metal-binding protein
MNSLKGNSSVIPFKVNNGLPQDLLRRLQEIAKQHEWDSVYPMKAGQIVVENWVRLKCQYGCLYYNSNWCCPPATPGPEEVRNILHDYSLALMLVGTQRCPEFYKNKKRKRARQVKYWKDTVSLERFLFLEGYYKAFSLISGPCALCKECAYPKRCHFPQERRPSLEAFSIDVVKTLQNLGLTTPIAMDVKDVFYQYAMILVE